MARIAVLRDQKRINVSIETELHSAVGARAKQLGIKGGFSEYVARLCVADLLRKNSIAPKFSRHLPRKRAKK